MSDERKGFGISDGKGFHMRFPNGLVVSVQFGHGNYCENRNSSETNIELGRIGSNTAEVAIWDENGDWRTKEFIKGAMDDVIGWVPPEKVAEIIFQVSKYKDLNLPYEVKR